MRVLVTGASGYLGAAFADACSGSGMEVLRAARVVPAAPGWVRMPDLDAGDFDSLPLDVDAVVHFAGIAHRHPPDVPDADTYRRVNGEAVGALARACRGRAAIMVFVSSVAAVGSAVARKITLDTTPRPITEYGASKLLGERRVSESLQGSPTAYRIIRLPGVFGPGAPGAVSHLADWIRRGRPIPSGCSHVRRSVISVYDAIDAIRVACLARSLDGLTMMPCAHPTPTTLDLARSIAAAAGVPFRVLPCPFSVLYAGITCLRTLRIGLQGPVAGLSRLVENCEIEDDTLQRVAGWRPPCGLEEGLRRTFGS